MTSTAIAKATNTVKQISAQPVLRPRIPRTVDRAVADPYDWDEAKPTRWEPPHVVPPKADLQEAMAQLTLHMQPATERFMRERLALARIVTGAVAGKPGEWAMRTAEYMRLLADIPPDIFAAGCDEAVKRKEWFPTPAALLRVMQPLLDQRKRMIKRLELLLRSGGEIEFKRDPLDVRLKASRDAWLKVGNIARAAASEIELARLRGDKPADWATAPPTPPVEMPALSESAPEANSETEATL